MWWGKRGADTLVVTGQAPHAWAKGRDHGHPGAGGWGALAQTPQPASLWPGARF